MTTEKEKNYSLPSNSTLQHCAKLAIVEDKPIMLDYWTDSCDKNTLIGVRETVKNGKFQIVVISPLQVQNIL